MGLLLYALAFMAITTVWPIAVAAVSTTADRNFGERGKPLWIAFAVLMTLVVLLAVIGLNELGCSWNLALEICER